MAEVVIVSATEIRGYIEGLVPEWNAPGTSQSNLSVTSGACFIPGLGEIIESPGYISPPAGALAANTFYFVYGYAGANGLLVLDPLVAYTPATPNAPVAYRGSAKQKPGDASRRYLGCVLTNNDATPRMMCFYRAGDFVRYREATDAAPFKVFDGTGATTLTTVSLAGAIPPTSRMAYCLDHHYKNIAAYWQDSAGALSAAQAGTRIWQGGYYSDANKAGHVPIWLATDQARQVQFSHNSGGYSQELDVAGYMETR